MASKGLPFKVSVVTGPSGSYREQDILNCKEVHEEPWGPESRWELSMYDAYGARPHGQCISVGVDAW